MKKRMLDRWNRREFLGSMAMTGAGAMLGMRPNLSLAANEPPPETTTLRWRALRASCWVPQMVAEPLLREEGFTDIQYIKYTSAEAPDKEDINVGKIDMTLDFSGRHIRDIVPGNPSVFISGLHAGCYSLIGSDKINSIRDLKGKKVWAWTNVHAGPALFFKAMLAYVGMDPEKDVEYVVVPMPEAVELFKKGEIDAFMSFPPGPQKLRAQGIGKVIVDTNVDKPWAQYFCCCVLANRDFITNHPVATRRALRAVLRATDMVARDPKMAARLLVEKGLKPAADEKFMAQAFADIPYAKWRDYNPEDTIRFYGLRLREIGLTKYSPEEIVKQNTDWSFLLSLKDELGLTWT
jgi:NitT/TauT family transport system substrate-binding protein